MLAGSLGTTLDLRRTGGRKVLGLLKFRLRRDPKVTALHAPKTRYRHAKHTRIADIRNLYKEYEHGTR
jgi:hypothetical protein